MEAADLLCADAAEIAAADEASLWPLVDEVWAAQQLNGATEVYAVCSAGGAGGGGEPGEEAAAAAVAALLHRRFEETSSWRAGAAEITRDCPRFPEARRRLRRAGRPPPPKCERDVGDRLSFSHVSFSFVRGSRAEVGAGDGGARAAAVRCGRGAGARGGGVWLLAARAGRALPGEPQGAVEAPRPRGAPRRGGRQRHALPDAEGGLQGLDASGVRSAPQSSSHTCTHGVPRLHDFLRQFFLFASRSGGVHLCIKNSTSPQPHVATTHD